jgi:dihydroorotase-like cyclic amidohydrolase
LKTITITEGSKANFTFFTPEGKSTFTKENILSKSKNSAFLGTEIKGSVYGILNQNKFVITK